MMTFKNMVGVCLIMVVLGVIGNASILYSAAWMGECAAWIVIKVLL